MHCRTVVRSFVFGEVVYGAHSVAMRQVAVTCSSSRQVLVSVYYLHGGTKGPTFKETKW
jgi:hypothetical protein